MAMADYRLCDVCCCKAFYDAELQYDFEQYPVTGLYNLGEWAAICRDCAQTHSAVIVKKGEPQAQEVGDA